MLYSRESSPLSSVYIRIFFDSQSAISFLVCRATGTQWMSCDVANSCTRLDPEATRYGVDYRGSRFASSIRKIRSSFLTLPIALQLTPTLLYRESGERILGSVRYTSYALHSCDTDIFRIAETRVWDRIFGTCAERIECYGM